MIVTSTECKKNLGKYLSLVGKEKIEISKNGRIIAELIPKKNDVKSETLTLLQSIKGIIKEDVDLDEMRTERILKGETLWNL